jgi:hypothetical protein
MASGHEQHGSHHLAAHHGPRVLPSTLGSPEVLSAWRTRSLIVGVVFFLLSVVIYFLPSGAEHVTRAYLHGWVLCFGFAGGGLIMLMLQYVTGGKWGLLLRRPLEAMAGTLPLMALALIPLGVSLFTGKSMYVWANFDTVAKALQAVKDHQLGLEDALTLISKRAMLNPWAAVAQSCFAFAVFLFLAFTLRRWSLQRDADEARGTEGSFERWRMKFENLSGPGILIYVILMTDIIIVWVMSLDVSWYSSVWGLKFMVGQGYGVLALGILTVICLSKVEPMKTMLRTTEQHDLGKFLFAFVMLNIYLTFAEFLILWSGNVPDEIPWYLARIHGGWWTICSLDFVCHWLIPFCLLLSRDLKRSKSRMKVLCTFMILARAIDLFWIIEPNFPDAAGNLHLAGNYGILAYITVPIAMLGLWGTYYLTLLNSRPLIAVNDPHLVEMLEAEHAH